MAGVGLSAGYRPGSWAWVGWWRVWPGAWEGDVQHFVRQGPFAGFDAGLLADDLEEVWHRGIVVEIVGEMVLDRALGALA